jgi:hypothetical protein
LVQAPKFFEGEGAMRAPPVVARETGGHPSAAKAPAPRAFDAMQVRLGKLGEKELSGAFLGDDWTTQGDGIGRYGRQIYSFPAYGASGWPQNYKMAVVGGPHRNEKSGGVYTYYHGLGIDSPRVQYIPNSAKRNQGEWNDGSFDRALYPEEWEGPDLWVDVAVPAGVHRVSLYFINYDGQKGNNRRRDYLLELKAKGAKREEMDFAPALARARMAQFFHGVYKHFVVSGPAEYSIKVGHNYSYVTKLSAVFLDRLVGPVPPHEPQGVPIMGDAQVKPPAMEGQAKNAAVRAAGEVWGKLDEGWGREDAVPLQRAYRMLALRLAAEQGGEAALLANWRFALPLMTAADHEEFARQIAIANERMFEQHPQMVETALRTKMADAWKKLQKPIEAGQAPDPTTLLRAKDWPADAEEIKGVLVNYLLLRAGKAINTRSLSTDEESPDGYLNEFKAVAKDSKALYRLSGEYLLYSEALAQQKSEKAKRKGLAAALAVTRAALEITDDTWLAARVSEAFLAPQLANAPDDQSVLGRAAVMKVITAAHTDDPEALKRLDLKPAR